MVVLFPRPGFLLDQLHLDQDLSSYVFFPKYFCVHINKSEHAGCFPGVNPPTLKSDVKVTSDFWPSLHSRSLSSHLSKADAPFPLSWSTTVREACSPVQLVDEQDILAPARHMVNEI
ncbi:hypothetical protein AB3S75_038722 [Citrus x aurantiifolia]